MAGTLPDLGPGSTLGTLAGAAIAFIAAAVGGFVWLRGKLGALRADEARQAGESQLIEQLTEREQRLMGEINDALRRERDNLQMQVAVAQRMATIEAENLRLRGVVRKLARRLPAELRDVVPSDLMGLEDAK